MALSPTNHLPLTDMEIIDPPSLLLMQCCGNCYFRRGIKCCFRPPQPITISCEGIDVTCWYHPEVSLGEWCGEWQHMPAEEKANG